MSPVQPVVYLHVGLMKTGTTFVQGVLQRNQDTLADEGILFPGRRWGKQVRATWDVLDLHHDDADIRAAASGMWARMTGQMLAHRGRASVFSVELLSLATPDDVVRVADSLSGATVHVVVTVRDTTKVMPALWQTLCKSRHTESWTGFVRGAMASLDADRGSATGEFEKRYDVPAMLRAWRTVLPPERIHVVTVPRPGSPPALLWERFADVIGVDPAVATERDVRSNPSLGHASAELLRLINTEPLDMSRLLYNASVKDHLGNRVLERRVTLERPIRLDREGTEFAAAWNHRTRLGVEQSGVHLVGDLGDLPVEVADAEDRLPGRAEPEQHEVLAAAAAAVDGMWELIDDRAEMLRRAGAPLSRQGTPPRPSGPAAPDRWAGPEPVRAAVTEVVSLVNRAVDQHRELRRRRRGHPTA